MSLLVSPGISSTGGVINWYEILLLTPDATPEEISHAYGYLYRNVKTFSSGSKNEKKARLRLLYEAHEEVLKDPNSRFIVDKCLARKRELIPAAPMGPEARELAAREVAKARAAAAAAARAGLGPAGYSVGGGRVPPGPSQQGGYAQLPAAYPSFLGREERELGAREVVKARVEAAGARAAAARARPRLGSNVGGGVPPGPEQGGYVQPPRDLPGFPGNGGFPEFTLVSILELIQATEAFPELIPGLILELIWSSSWSPSLPVHRGFPGSRHPSHAGFPAGFRGGFPGGHPGHEIFPGGHPFPAGFPHPGHGDFSGGGHPARGGFQVVPVTVVSLEVIT
ncbi:hypothetical protein B0H63DRAFT_559871 [Podospora didyma]|uniref:J domain-containing protein n=1 Tax=Podospora didyma TaxID=330526 RepID=A0AAE0TZB6_9PEZI|nr:hypothetical protein B0H63DRAFT_559871 [Podospora didyma]